MTYIRRGGNRDFGDKPTPMGEGLAKRYEEGLWKRYYENLEKYKKELKEWKKEHKEYIKKYKEYEENLKLWDKKAIHKISFSHKKPEPPIEPIPPEKPTKPFLDNISKEEDEIIEIPVPKELKEKEVNREEKIVEEREYNTPHKKRIKSLSYYWYHYKIYFYLLILIALIIFSYNHREEISNKIKIYYDKYFGEKEIEDKPNETLVTIKIINELINSHSLCSELDVNKRPSTCLGICKKVAGEYIDDRCTGEKEVYCRCKIEIKEYIVEEKKEETQEESEEILNKITGIFETEPISDKTKEIEKLIFKYTNEERAKYGSKALEWDDKLADIAREHSLDMANNDFFSHVNQKGEDPTARAIRNSYNVHKELGGGWYSEGIGENIVKMPTGSVIGVGYVSSDPESIARAEVSSWMESPRHRENILNNQYDGIGVGVAYDGLYYVATQDFI